MYMSYVLDFKEELLKGTFFTKKLIEKVTLDFSAKL